MGFDAYPPVDPLDGSEKLLVKQGGSTKGVTVQAVRDFERTISLSQPGPLQVFTGTARWYPPRAITIRSMQAFVGESPTGAALTFNLLKNAAVIASGSINDGAFISTEVTGIDTALATTDHLTLDITQVGSTIAGSDLLVRIGLQGA